MQVGSQTFLEYQIDIDFINKPTNLKFYYDSDKTREIEVSNECITSKGFISYREKQTRDETIYWAWPLETGTTEDEIARNDEIDTTFMNKIMEMTITAKGKQVKEPTIDMYTTAGIAARYEGKHNTSDGYSADAQTWYDISGNGRNGIVNNATFGTNCLNFINGNDSWVNLGKMNYENITLEVTFNANMYTDWERHIIDNCEDGGYSLHIFKDKLRASIYINGGWTLSDEIAFELGKIYNFSLTYDGKKFCIYLNGEKQQEIEVDGVIGVPLRNTVMAMGVNPTGDTPNNGGYFKGKIYSAAVYSEALTENEIAQNAQIALEFARSN